MALNTFKRDYLTLLHFKVLTVFVRWRQSFVDIFFIDWERPQGKVVSVGGTAGGCSVEVPVTIWRTYFVANEWNEIQTVRQINPVFQYFAAVFFLSVVGFGNIATMDPRSDFHTATDDVVYHAPMSNILRYACVTIVYISVGQLAACFIPRCIIVGVSPSCDGLSKSRAAVRLKILITINCTGIRSTSLWHRIAVLYMMLLVVHNASPNKTYWLLKLESN